MIDLPWTRLELLKHGYNLPLRSPRLIDMLLADPFYASVANSPTPPPEHTPGLYPARYAVVVVMRLKIAGMI